MKQKLISIIIPLFNEEANIRSLLEALCGVLERGHFHFEIILVDDGSSDGTFKEIRRMAEKDGRIFGLRFRRNHGQTAAIKAGFDHARGEVCLTMDGDLQHDPENIPLFLQKIEEGYDVVCSYRKDRNDTFLRRFPSRVANGIARLFSGLSIQDFGSTYRAYNTELAREIPIYGEMHRFIPVFLSMHTSRITEIPITLKPRVHGSSKYGLSRTFRVFSDLLVLLFFAGFFNRPIHIFGYISFLLGIPGFIILSWLSCGKIFGSLAIMDYSPLFFLGVILCLMSAQMFTTGIVCEYLIRIYYNNGRRKVYTLGETSGRHEDFQSEKGVDENSSDT